MKNQGATVLLLADRRLSHTSKTLKAAGYRLMTTFTPDHAVAICVNNSIDVVVLDQEHFVVTENWSVAQSLKMIKPSTCVILVVRGKIVAGQMPNGIDAIVPEHDGAALLRALKKIFS
jgi:actin-like ATPase involved in cell morphogenesis